MKKIISWIFVFLLLLNSITVLASGEFRAEITDYKCHLDIADNNSITIRLENVSSASVDVQINSTLKTLSGEAVCSETLPVTLGGKSTVYQPIKLDFPKRGEYKLFVSVLNDGKEAVSYEKYMYVSESAQSFTDIGVCTHFDYDTFYNPDDMTLLKNTGFSMIRDECRWQNVEKKKGVYTIPAHVLEYIEEAEKTNTEVLLMLAFNNTLYSENECDIPVTTENTEAFLKYVRFVVSQLKGKVKYFELWNEPNHENFNRNNATVKQFVDLLKESYAVIKEENPEAVVISGGTAGSSNAGDYIKEMVNAGALNYMDALGIHPYCLNGTIVDERSTVDYSSDIDYIIENCGVTKDIWITEVGYPIHDGLYTDKEKGAYNIRTMLEFIADGRVKKMFVYQLKHTERGEGYALMNSNGVPYEAFKMVDVFGERVSNADFVKKMSGIYYSAYQFKDRTTNDDIFVLWTKRDTERELKVTASNSETWIGINGGLSKLRLDVGAKNAENKIYKYDAFGNCVELNEGSAFKMNYEPVYIVCEKPQKENSCEITMENGFIKGAGYISGEPAAVTVKAVSRHSGKTVYLGQKKTGTDGDFEFSFKAPGTDVFDIYIYNGAMNYEKINNGSVDVIYSVMSDNTKLENIGQLQDNSQINVQTVIENNGASLGELTLVIAAYTVDGRLVSAESNKIIDEGNSTSELPVNMTVENQKAIDSIKLFLWDKEMKPVGDKLEIK